MRIRCYTSEQYSTDYLIAWLRAARYFAEKVKEELAP